MRQTFTFILFFLFSINVFGQLYISPQKYTSTAFTTFNVNGACYGSGLEMYVNDIKVTNFTYGLCNFGICQFRFPFGTLKVGDVLKVKDNCGNFSNNVTIDDDYVYVEVAGGTSYSSNGIGPTDEGLPYGRLSNKLNVGKCENVGINAHALHNFEYFVTPGTNPGTYTSGTIKVNGTEISTSDVTIDKLGKTASNISVAAGKISYNSGATIFINQNFSGRTPLNIEYLHNGILPSQDQEFGLGPLRVRLWNNNKYSIYEYKFDGSIAETEINANISTSSFKITFDLGFFKLFVDNIEKYSIRRSVIYSSSSGSISNGALLDYGTGITWSPSGSGEQWVGALLDGVRYTRQYFNVAEDMAINNTIINVACNGSATGSINMTVTGGQAPLQYSKDGISYSSNNVFGGLTAGNYTVYVRDASGCSTSTTATVTENAAMGLSISSSTNANCAGQANGSATLSASGGTGIYQYSKDNVNFQNAATFNSLTSGSYTFYVKDPSGCTNSVTGSIGLNSSLNASVLSKNNLLCNADNTGSVTLSQTGTAVGPVQYSKDALVFQTSPSFAGLSAGSYTFTAKDNLCTVTVSTALTEPAVLNISGNIDQQVSCFGGANAKISNTATGGSTPYLFSADGISYASPNVFDNLPIGNYKYFVKDQNGCIASTPIYTITQPTDILFSVANKTEVSCFAGNDGSVTLLGSGGVPNYQYSIDNVNFQGSETFAGLTAGLKNFYIKDQNACVKTLTSNVLQPTLFQVSVSTSQNLVCNGISTGKVVLAGTGGMLPYTYANNGGTGQSSTVFDNLAAGTYTFSAKDAKNCPVTLPSLTLTQPSPIVIVQTLKLDVDCETYTKGALSFVASGSNGGFGYTLTGTNLKQETIAAISSADGKFTELGAGNYILTARDQLACEKTYVASIVPKSSAINFDLNATLPSTCLTQDGSISISNISGGRPAYTYRISSETSFGTQNTFTGLGNGNYIITVADELCAYNKSVDLRLPNSLNAAYTITPQSCTTPNANVSIAPISGGSGNYQLALNGAFSSNTIFNNLKPNTYTVFIKDNPLTCQTALSFEVKEQNRADLKTSLVQNISCFGGSDGLIQVKGDNNLSPFLYSFNNLNSFSSNNSFSGLPIGNYRVYAQNSIGCLDSIKVSLNQPTLIVWQVTPKNNDCFGDKTGEILITASGGTPPYQYAIDNNFVSNGNFTGLIAGNYTPAIKDAKACTFQKPQEIIQPTELKITPIYKDTITCFGLSNGVIFISAEGGTPQYTYAFQNENVYDIKPTFENLKAGKYQFFVRDSKKCLKETELTITEPPLLTLDLVSKADPLCIGEKNGKIEVKAAGGNTGGYTYIIDNGLKQSKGLFIDLNKGIYTFAVEDRKACKATITKVELLWPKALEASFSQKQPICFGDANATVSLLATGGVGGYTADLINKDLPPTKDIVAEGQFFFSGLKAGIYEFAIKDKNGCQLSVVSQIKDAEKLELFKLPKDTTVCKEQLVKINIGNTSNKVQWLYNGADLINNTQNVVKGGEIIVSKPGLYEVKVSNTTGCESKGSFELKNSTTALIADFLMTIEAFEGDTVYALDISKPTPDEIIWTLPAAAYTIKQNTDGMIFQISTKGKYTIEMLARKGECENIKIREIEIFKKEEIEQTSGALFYNAYDIFKSLNVFPNPNYGKFDVDVKLSKVADIELLITRASNGTLVYKDLFKGQASYLVPVVLKNFMQDNYLVTVRVGNVVLVKRILIMN